MRLGSIVKREHLVDGDLKLSVAGEQVRGGLTDQEQAGGLLERQIGRVVADAAGISDDLLGVAPGTTAAIAPETSTPTRIGSASGSLPIWPLYCL
jgi:hypothetical protein